MTISKFRGLLLALSIFGPLASCVSQAQESAVIRFDKPPLFGYGTWKDQTKLETNQLQLNMPDGKGGIGFNLVPPVNLQSQAEHSPAIRLTIAPENQLKTLRLMLSDNKGANATWNFPLAGKATGESIIVTPVDGAPLRAPNVIVKGELNLASIQQWQLQGDWGGGLVALKVEALETVAPTEALLAARDVTDKKRAGEAVLREVPIDRAETPVVALTQQVNPTATTLHYSGRWDKSNPAESVSAWSASAVTLKFRGRAVQAKLALGNNRIEVVIDGKVTKILVRPQTAAPTELTTYDLASGLTDGPHTVSLFKITEASVGTIRFGGFGLGTEATPLPAVAPKRYIEVIGDSISAGYGIEAPDQNQRFSPDTENAYRTYGALTARAFGADYSCIAWSGRTMWPDFTLPEVYDRTLPQDANSKWNGWTQAPDVILINLSTNDFNRKTNPEEEAWVAAYQKFLTHLRTLAPKATIYLAVSPMLSDDWPKERKTRSTSRSYIQRVIKERNAAGDNNVRYLEFETQKVSDGLGADWHPSLKTNQIMADKFIAAIKADLNWTAVVN